MRLLSFVSLFLFFTMIMAHYGQTVQDPSSNDLSDVTTNVQDTVEETTTTTTTVIPDAVLEAFRKRRRFRFNKK